MYGAPNNGKMVPTRIVPSELVAFLRQQQADGSDSTKKLLIVDVRDDDFVGGHIRGAINLPEDHFMDDEEVDQLVQRFRHFDQIVFHCMLSQMRGPFCAQRFASRVQVVLDQEPHRPEVTILHGGFQTFKQMYKDDKTLFEDLS